MDDLICKPVACAPERINFVSMRRIALVLTHNMSHDATDGREKDGSRSLKTSHLGHDFDDGYISLTSSHIVRRGLTGASQNELYTSI